MSRAENFNAKQLSSIYYYTALQTMPSSRLSCKRINDNIYLVTNLH